MTKTTLLVAVMTTVAQLAVAAPDPARVPVFVQTVVDPSGFVDADTTLRMKLVENLNTVLRKHRAKQLDLAPTIETAKLVVDVLEKTSQVTEADSLGALVNSLNTMSGGLRALRPKEAESNLVTVRHATITVGSYVTEVTGKDYPQLFRAIELWVKANASKLP